MFSSKKKKQSNYSILYMLFNLYLKTLINLKNSFL
jgi:hypothetical protein